MFRWERKVLEWVEKHIYIIAFAGVTILGGVIRMSLRNHVSADAESSLLPWYNMIVKGGQIQALKYQVGNYNLLYQFLIVVMTYLPLNPLSAYKLLSCIFDYLLAGAMGWLVYTMAEKEKVWKFLAAYSMVLLSPLVIANSATWAQCDSIYTFWLVLTVLFLLKGKFIRAFVFFGLAMSFKLQAIFLLPFLLLAYFCLRKFSVLYFAIVPAVMWLSGIPAFLMGRSFRDVFFVYQFQVSDSGKMSYHYPSFWLLFCSENMDMHRAFSYPYSIYKTAAILLTLCVLAAWMILWIYRKVEWNGQNLLYAAFLLTYTTVLLLPAMHERYGFAYEILAIAIAFRNRKTFPLLAMLTGMSILTYGNFLLARQVDYYGLACINCGVYLAYCHVLGKEMSVSGKEFSNTF
ncbi:MAG: DUF2029 domain-containing protein [Lachnospiraceae bacterium]|nr:DUF2029 domain-containing protein [Lachnospiraceae bacterium]